MVLPPLAPPLAPPAPAVGDSMAASAASWVGSRLSSHCKWREKAGKQIGKGALKPVVVHSHISGGGAVLAGGQCRYGTSNA